MRFGICFLAAAVCSSVLFVDGAHADLTIADSVLDFSSTQGRDNWFYGYYQGTLDRSSFTQMTEFGVIPNVWTVDYELPLPFYWTGLWNVGGHPSAAPSTGGRTSAVHWAVRRWVSEVTGMVTISGVLADIDTVDGNGVIGRIFLDDTQVYQQTLDNGNLQGIDYSFNLFVTAGQTLDFAIDPRGGDDRYDSTRFTALVRTVPEPGSLLLTVLGFIAGGFLLARFRSTPTPSVDPTSTPPKRPRSISEPYAVLAPPSTHNSWKIELRKKS
ncbi:MAG: PEP-CTERM sorting domain-containing protein [Isosphaeraceae bacterium]|nr:PEP-CTERM sorting domain-containing protein [Isosphaeraceae bacterium]